jgi:hypothetical protein
VWRHVRVLPLPIVVSAAGNPGGFFREQGQTSAMSRQLLSWLWWIALVLSPIASILHLARCILCDLQCSIAAMQKVRHMMRPTAARRAERKE